MRNDSAALFLSHTCNSHIFLFVSLTEEECMQLGSEKGVVSSRDLDFLASSFARMHLHGRHLCTDAITGNMDEDCRLWFLDRYDFYVEHLKDKELQ